MAEPDCGSPHSLAVIQRCLGIVGEHVAASVDELGVSLAETDDAVGRTLSACERLEQALAGTAWAGVGAAATTSIYEACSLHDVTGQRLAKVVHALRHMQGRLADLLQVGGLGTVGGVAPRGDSGLLNGPQHPSDAIAQATVDRMLAGNE